ncbi:hypothetical protein V4Y02_24135, partial [Escherichia coli]
KKERKKERKKGRKEGRKEGRKKGKQSLTDLDVLNVSVSTNTTSQEVVFCFFQKNAGPLYSVFQVIRIFHTKDWLSEVS